MNVLSSVEKRNVSDFSSCFAKNFLFFACDMPRIGKMFNLEKAGKYGF